MMWIDRIPLYLLALVAIWLAVAPVFPKPHLVEKLQWLFQGTLTRPMDIFDLFLHGSPTVLLVIKLLRGLGNHA